MSRLRSLHPELASAPLPAFFSHVAVRRTFYYVLRGIEAFYARSLPMHSVLSHFGIDLVLGPDAAQSVPCRFPEHGSEDAHFSAKYFPEDSRTGETVGAVYCFKCGMSRMCLWYFHALAPTKTFAATLDLMHRIFTLPPFPREVVLDFDPAIHFTFEDGPSKVAMSAVDRFRETATDDSAESRRFLYSLLAGP